MHTCSAYPANYPALNLRVIPELRKRYGVLVGYSGHETGIPTSVASVGLGACVVERHITLDRGDVGQRPGGIAAETERSYPFGARYPPGGDIHGRWRETG